jgi:SAM-dependent methyltransferase
VERSASEIPGNRALDALLEELQLPPVEEIAPEDRMYRYNPAYYFQAGRDALRCIRLAMIAGQVESIQSILDLPCGHGRILRALKAAFPEAELTACDILRDGVDFCAQVIGATPVYSEENPADIPLDGPFDLIWCASLLTHVGEAQWEAFLRLFESVLSPGGLVVFTTFGSAIAERRLRDRNQPLDLTEEQIEKILEDYDRTGFGYCANLSSFPSDYGNTISSPAWVCKKLEMFPKLQLVLYTEGGWGPKRDHWSQDAVGCVRLP